MPDPWRTLALYESSDLVRRLYAQRGRTLSAERATEIVSQLAQSREFLTQARGAGDLIRPLLLYYGVLSASRALILFESRNLREASLQKAHGLSVERWTDILATGPARVGELPITVGVGTFSELVQATRNVERSTVSRRGNLLAFPLSMFRAGALDDLEGASIRLEDILARLPDVSDLFERTFDRPSACHAANVELGEAPPSVLVRIPVRPGCAVPVGEPAAPLGEHGTVQFDDDGLRGRTDRGRTAIWSFEAPAESELIRLLGDAKNAGSGHLFLVEPLARKEFSTLLLLYLCSYGLGMLVRYFPSTWMRMMARQTGDVVYPLLRAATELIERRFPELIVREFEDVSSRRPAAARAP